MILFWTLIVITFFGIAVTTAPVPVLVLLIVILAVLLVLIFFETIISLEFLMIPIWVILVEFTLWEFNRIICWAIVTAFVRIMILAHSVIFVLSHFQRLKLYLSFLLETIDMSRLKQEIILMLDYLSLQVLDNCLVLQQIFIFVSCELPHLALDHCFFIHLFLGIPLDFKLQEVGD